VLFAVRPLTMSFVRSFLSKLITQPESVPMLRINSPFWKTTDMSCYGNILSFSMRQSRSNRSRYCKVWTDVSSSDVITLHPHYRYALVKAQSIWRLWMRSLAKQTQIRRRLEFCNCRCQIVAQKMTEIRKFQISRKILTDLVVTY
jgi:hypothetical protein